MTRVSQDMDETVFRVRTRPENGVMTVALSGELDLAGVAELQQAIEHARALGERLVVDLSDLEFIDSSGLRVLVGLHNAAETQGFDYSILPGPPVVQRAFALCGLDRTLRFVA
jgi:anti-anti-sigma factor